MLIHSRLPKCLAAARINFSEQVLGIARPKHLSLRVPTRRTDGSWPVDGTASRGTDGSKPHEAWRSIKDNHDMGDMPMRILHIMLRVGDLDRSIDFYTKVLEMRLLRRKDYPDGQFTLALSLIHI